MAATQLTEIFAAFGLNKMQVSGSVYKTVEFWSPNRMLMYGMLWKLKSS